MLNGLETAASGGRVQAARIDIIADNLANMTATGSKADYAAVQAAASGRTMSGPGGLVTSPDFSEGGIIDTGRDLDVALSGDGFLSVSDGRTTCYTRNGVMHIDGDKQLALAGGLKVLGEGGQPITVTGELPIRITGDGQVMEGTESRGRLDRVRFDNPAESLKRLNGNFVAANPKVEPERSSAEVHQGAREASNVSSVRAMVELIEASRAFEANMRMVQYMSATLGRLVSSVGNLS